MRVFLIPALAVASLLGACAPHSDAYVVGVSVQHQVHQPRHPHTHAPVLRQAHTVTPIRPDATGYFPGDYAAAWNAGPAYEAAHHGGGAAGSAYGTGHQVQASDGKYTPEGKYAPAPSGHGIQADASSYSGAAAGRRPVPGHSAYEAHRVYRPPMDCAVVSQAYPETWIAERYVCVEH